MKSTILTLTEDNPILQSVLYDGRILHEEATWIALPRERVVRFDGTHCVLFELTHPLQRKRPSLKKIIQDQQYLGAFNTAFLPGLVILLQGYLNHRSVSWGTSISALLGVFFLQISARALDDFQGFLSLSDLTQREPSPRGALQLGWLTPRALRKWAYISLSVGVLLGIPSVINQPKLLFIGALAVASVLFFSNDLFRLKDRFGGNFVIFLLLGPFFSLGFSQASFREWDGSVLFLGFFFGFLAWARAHIKTLHSFHSSIRLLNYRFFRHFYVALYLAAFSSLTLSSIVFQVPESVIFAPVIIFIPLFRHILIMYAVSGPSSPRLGDLRRDSIRLHFALIVIIISLMLI